MFITNVVEPLNETDLALAGVLATSQSAGLVGQPSGSAVVNGVLSSSVGAAPGGDVTLLMNINVVGPVSTTSGVAYTSGVYTETVETVSGPVAPSAGSAPAGSVATGVNVLGPVATTSGAGIAGGISTSTLGPVAGSVSAARNGTLIVGVTIAGVPATSSGAALTAGVVAGVSIDVSGVVASGSAAGIGGDVSGSAKVDGVAALGSVAAGVGVASTAVSMAPPPATSVAASLGEVDTDSILFGGVSTSVGASTGDLVTDDIFTGNLATASATAFSGEVSGDANIVGETSTSNGGAFGGAVVGDANVAAATATSNGVGRSGTLYLVRIVNVHGHTSQSRARGTADISVGISPFISAQPAYSIGSAAGGSTHGSARMAAYPATSTGRTYESYVVTEWNISVVSPEAFSQAVALIGALYYDWAVFGEVAESAGMALDGRTDLTPLFVVLRAIWRVALGTNQRQREMVDVPPGPGMPPGRGMVSTPTKVMQPSRRSMVELPRTMSPEVRE